MLRWFAIPQARKYIRLEQEPLLDRLEQAVVENARFAVNRTRPSRCAPTGICQTKLRYPN
jgi:hypothetical protein